MAQPWCRHGTRLKIQEFQEHDLPHSSSVAIIHPNDLEKELSLTLMLVHSSAWVIAFEGLPPSLNSTTSRSLMLP